MAVTPVSGNMAAKIREAALDAIKHLPHAMLGEGQINDIISRIGSDQLSMSERLARAATLAVDIAKDYANKPINYSAATTEQVNRARVAMGLSPLGLGAAHMRHAADAAGGNRLSNRGGNQFSELKNGGAIGDASTGHGSGFSWLTPANQHIPGFNQAQVASAANFLKQIGGSREDVNHDTKHMVHLQPYRAEIGELAGMADEIKHRRAQGLDTTEQERKYHERKQEVRGRMKPTQQQHFDHMRRIDIDAAKKFEHDGRNQNNNHTETHEKRVADNRTLGIQKGVEAENRKKVAEADKKPDAIQTSSSRLRRSAQQSEQTAASTTPAVDVAPTQTAATSTAVEQKKTPEQRQANVAKPAIPKV